jgi:hypothetical protein
MISEQISSENALLYVRKKGFANFCGDLMIYMEFKVLQSKP